MTLAETLQQTAPISLLAMKARRLGLGSVDALLSLAVKRGCRHYCATDETVVDPGLGRLGNDELAILLLAGSLEYKPNAIRCAAQLMRAPGIEPERLAFLAIREKSQRALWHIANAGLAHDPEGLPFWQKIMESLGPMETREEPVLPHWSRFVSMPGYQRGGHTPARWLVPASSP